MESFGEPVCECQINFIGIDAHIPPNASKKIKIITTVGAIDFLFFILFIQRTKKSVAARVKRLFEEAKETLNYQKAESRTALAVY